MKQKEKQGFNTDFEADVYKGLTSYPKHLSSKYFYGEKGDQLFQEIMELPEYYLTSLEYQILEKNKAEIARAFRAESGFDLIELGAGDGKKTKVLLSHFKIEKMDFKYVPVDISENVLQQLKYSLHADFNDLEVEPKPGTYSEVLEQLSSYKKRKKIILFLGSNIGNMKYCDAINFLKKISAAMNEQDLLFIGFDQKKDPQTILNAYNDKSGTTAAFNKNLLSRINKEMEANFDLDTFIHWPIYNPETGAMKSYLVSRKEQKVQIKSLNLEVPFQAWESILTEISQKYDEDLVQDLAQGSGLFVSGFFSDENAYFKNYIFKKNKKS